MLFFPNGVKINDDIVKFKVIYKSRSNNIDNIDFENQVYFIYMVLNCG